MARRDRVSPAGNWSEVALETAWRTASKSRDLMRNTRVMLTVVTGLRCPSVAPVPSTCNTKFSMISSWPATGAAAMTRLSLASTMMRALSLASAAVSSFWATPSTPSRIIEANSSAFILVG